MPWYWKGEKVCGNEKELCSKQEDILFKSISPQKSFLKKWQMLLQAKKSHMNSNQMYFWTRVLCKSQRKMCDPWSPPPPNRKNCCSYFLDFHTKELTCIANQQKHCFMGHILRTWFGEIVKSALILNIPEYCNLLSGHRIHSNGNQEPNPFTRVCVCKLKKLNFKSSTEDLFWVKYTYIRVENHLFFILLKSFM